MVRIKSCLSSYWVQGENNRNNTNVHFKCQLCILLIEQISFYQETSILALNEMLLLEIDDVFKQSNFAIWVACPKLKFKNFPLSA